MSDETNSVELSIEKILKNFKFAPEPNDLIKENQDTHNKRKDRLAFCSNESIRATILFLFFVVLLLGFGLLMLKFAMWNMERKSKYPPVDCSSLEKDQSLTTINRIPLYKAFNEFMLQKK